MTKQEDKRKTCFDEDGPFEENGLMYERITLTIPQNIVNLYRIQAMNAGRDYSEAIIIIQDAVMQDFNAKIEGMNSQNFKEMFNLKEAIDRHLKE